MMLFKEEQNVESLFSDIHSSSYTQCDCDKVRNIEPVPLFAIVLSFLDFSVQSGQKRIIFFHAHKRWKASRYQDIQRRYEITKSARPMYVLRIYIYVHTKLEDVSSCSRRYSYKMSSYYHPSYYILQSTTNLHNDIRFEENLTFSSLSVACNPNLNFRDVAGLSYATLTIFRPCYFFSHLTSSNKPAFTNKQRSCSLNCVPWILN